jgi:uncharacterized integral membrane protein (TIGR00698 family)
MWGAEQPVMRALRISPLIVGILMGAVIGNVAGANLPSSWGDGITFSAKKILRLAIILYGFRITFAQIADVGMAGFVLDVLMVSLTLIIGIFVGTRWLGMDKETAIMTSCGAAICGAAAVVATEPVVKAEAHKTAIAVATVVIFGTTAMFLYPLVYRTGIVPMTEDIFGIYIGASVHEVAHVVGAGEAVSAATANTAVIVKMTRVMLLAPALLAIGWFLNRQESKESDTKTALVIPWFAVGFVAVAGFNSLGLLGEDLVQQLIDFDTFLLTMAMTALGLSTVVAKFKGIGWKPLQLALVLAVWLIVGGFVLTQVLLSL